MRPQIDLNSIVVGVCGILLVGSVAFAQDVDCTDQPRSAEELEAAGEIDCNENGIPDRCDISTEMLTLDPKACVEANTPSSALLLDVDGDGKRDLVYVEEEDGRFSIVTRYGDDQDRFERESRTSPIQGDWRSVRGLSLANGDINGDGRPDIAIQGETENQDDWSLVLGLGGSDSEFEFAYTLGGNGTTLEAPGTFQDLDRDGSLEFVWSARAPDGSSSVLQWIESDEDGVRVESGPEFPGRVRGMVWSDFDGDGRLDLAWSDQKHQIYLATRRPGGDYSDPLALPFAAFYKAAADIDGDGSTDLALAVDRFEVIVAWNDGAGGFSAENVSSVSIPFEGLAVFAADVDGDGDLDVGGAYRGRCRRDDVLLWIAIQRSTRDIDPIARPVSSGEPARERLNAPIVSSSRGAFDGVIDSRSDELCVYFGRMAAGSRDCDDDGVPDECSDLDCDQDLIPDACEPDADADAIPDGCESDCDANGIADAQEIDRGTAEDCNDNGIPDRCELAFADRDSDGRLDGCQLRDGEAEDCNANGVPDSADLISTMRFRLNTVDAPAIAEVAPAIQSVAFTAADVDGDGWTDVVFASSGSRCPRWPGRVDVYSNLRGRFVVRRGVAQAGSLVRSVNAGDLNGDGSVDLVVGSSSDDGGDSSLEFLYNSGRGSFFGRRLALPLPPGLVDTAIADFDGDGDLDVAAAIEGLELDPARISLWMNDGSGRFVSGLEFECDVRSPSIRTPDLDGDGNPDLAVSGFGDRHVWIVYSSDPSREVWATPPVESRERIEIDYGDVDGDGDLDALGMFPSTDRAGFLYRNDGRAEFEVLPLEETDFAGIPVFRSFGEGARFQLFSPQLISRSTSGAMARLIDRRIVAAGPRYFAPGVMVGRPLVFDVDRDGTQEIVIGSEEGISILESSNAGDEPAIERIGEYTVVRPFEAVDLDGDRDQDIVAIRPFLGSRGPSQVLFNRAGRFEPLEQPELSPDTLAVGNLAGDQRSDLVARIGEGMVLRIGDRAAPSGFRDPEVVSESVNPICAVAVDLDGDDSEEIVAGSFNTRSLHTFFVEDGVVPEFTPGPVLVLGAFPLLIRSADFDRDGLQDLVVYTYEIAGEVQAHAIAIILGRGDGSFDRVHQYFLETEGYAAIASDVDSDGNEDVVVGGQEFAVVFRGLGDGRLADPFRIGDRRQRSTVVRDLDGDGRNDFAFLYPGRLAVHTNSGGMTFVPAREYRIPHSIYWIDALDVDLDGDLDIVGAESSSSSLVLIENVSPPLSRDVNGDGVPDECSGDPFVRGDANADGRRNVADAIAILNRLFGDASPGSCRDADDVNDDGGVQISDAIALLLHLFGTGWESLPAPDTQCDVDPVADRLECASFPPCRAE